MLREPLLIRILISICSFGTMPWCEGAFSHMPLFWFCSLNPPSGAVYRSTRQVGLGKLNIFGGGALGGFDTVSGCFLKCCRCKFVVSGFCGANRLRTDFHWYCCSDIYRERLCKCPSCSWLFVKGAPWQLVVIYCAPLIP